MSFSFASMIRLLALGAVGLTMLAVGVSRLAPPEPAHRIESPVATVSVHDNLLGVPDRQPRWLDAARGTIAVTPLHGDDVVEVASCSPWVDDQGRRQVVGRWSNRTYDGAKTVANEFGIARLSIPDGRLIDRVPLEAVPISPPCWLPGDRARVLFVAGDGQLRRFDFEPNAPDADLGGPGSADAQASLVSWDCPLPGVAEVHLNEIHWPRLRDARCRDLLIATLRAKSAASEPRATMSRSEVWWLRLDASGRKIVAAGPLMDPEGGDDAANRGDDHNPTVAVLADGTIGLAFTRAVGVGPGAWSICLGTLEFGADGRPRCREETVRVVDVRDHLVPLAFSPDGRWLNAPLAGSSRGSAVGRYRTTAETVARLEAETRRCR